jgi:hypothetical protein
MAPTAAQESQISNALIDLCCAAGDHDALRADPSWYPSGGAGAGRVPGGRVNGQGRRSLPVKYLLENQK